MFPLLDIALKALVFIVILSILVIIHELGHYLVAKKLGIKVEEFGFGFPPKVWGKKIGETLYTLNLLPIGGFVKLFGEDDAGGGRVGVSDNQQLTTKNNKDVKRAFFARPVWQRAAVVVAGVVMNIQLAAVIYYDFLGLSGF
jgi:regulator of sigma E protease